MDHPIREHATIKPESDRITQLRRLPRLLRVIFDQFKTFIICSIIAFILSTWLIYTFYPVNELPKHHHSVIGIAYDVVQMTFFQTPIPFVDDWRLIPVFFGLPILGLIVISEGVVRLGHLLLQRKLHSKEWQEMLAATYENHIVVAGLGNVGFRVTEQLRRFGESVVCIERNPETVFVAEMEKLDVPVLIGDIKNASILENASIRKAKAFLAVTDNDLANLESGLTARELSPDLRIILRIFDQRLAEKIENSFGINCAYSASSLAAPVFAQSALSENILASFEFGGAIVNAFQLIVDESSPMCGQTIDHARKAYEVTVMMHECKGSVDWNPDPNTLVTVGDKLLIMADNKNIRTFLLNERKVVAREGSK